MKKISNNPVKYILRSTAGVVLMAIIAVFVLHREPVMAYATPVVPGDPIPQVVEETVPETVPETEPYVEPTVPQPQPQHVHNSEVDRRDATCTEAGYVHEYCTSCGETLSYTEIPAMGHEYHETSRVEPQVGVPGYIEYTCVRNDDQYRTPLEALPEPETQPEETQPTEPEEEEEPEHTHRKSVTDQAATCTTDGYHHVECVDCGEVLEHTVVPAHGHSWNAWHVVKAATYEENGMEQHECVHCGIVETRSIPMLTRPEETQPTEPAPTEPSEPEQGEDACEDFIF